jgi:hypothetical protein
MRTDRSLREHISIGPAEVSRLMMIVVVGLAAAASIVSIRNGFALDDVHIIANNERLHSLRNLWHFFGETYWPPEHGASLYRPLTSIAFAIQWVIGDGSPALFHAVNIVLYVAVCGALFGFAKQIMNERAAFIGAAVFAVHPLHVEAVANVVGQAELWVALLVLLSVSLYVKQRRSSGPTLKDAVAMCAMYGAALMFKEHAIVLPALLIAAELILVASDSEKLAVRARRRAPLLLGMFLVAIAFVTVRTLVIGRFAGGSTALVLLGQDFPARFFTMLNIVPEWLRLFFWPVNLSADYSPPRIETATSFKLSMVPGLIALAGAGVIAVRLRRTRPAASYALVFSGICLLIPSNLVIVTGFALAERALLLGSVGVALAIGVLLSEVMNAASGVSRRALVAAVAAVLIAATVRSSARSTVWHDNETLFRQTVEDVPTSYRAHLMLGELLTDEGQMDEGLKELVIAVRLSRSKDAFVRWLTADRFHAAGQLHAAARYYREALAIKPSDQRTRYGLAMCLATMGEKDEALSLAKDGLRRDPSNARFARIVHMIDSIAVSTVSLAAATER